MDNKQRLKLITEAEQIMWESPKQAVAMALEVYEAGPLDDSQELYLRTLFCISRCHWVMGHFSESLLYAHRLMDYAKEWSNNQYRGKAHLVLGNSYLYMGSYQRSLKHFLRTLELAVEVDDAETHSAALNNIGEIYNNLGDYDKAFDYYEQSRVMAEATRNIRNLGVSYLNLADIAYKKNNHQKALKYIEIAMEYNKEINDLIGIAYTLSTQADVLSSMGNYDDALECLFEAKEMAMDTEDNFNLMQVNERLLDVYKNMGEFEAYEKLAVESVDFAKLSDAKDWTTRFAESLAEFYEANDQIEKAYNYLQIAFKYKKTAFDEMDEQHKKTIEMQFQMKNTENEKRLIAAYNEQLTSKNNELSKLYENIKHISQIGKELTATLNSHEIYQKTYNYLKVIAPVDFFGISMYLEESDKIVPEFYINKGVIEHIGYKGFQSKDSLAGYCIYNKKAIVSDDLQKDYKLYKGKITDKEIHSVIFMPLILDDRVLGAITIQSEELGVYGPREISYMEALSSYFAIAIVNAKYSEALKLEASEREKNEAELEALNEQLLQLSRLDTLTKIPNRRRFNEFLEDLLKVYVRNKMPLAVILVDVDYFKQYNDNYGHIQGDYVLEEVSKVLQNSINREVDFVARYGGDEFVVILPNADFEGCQVVAKAIVANIRQMNIEHLFSKVADHITLTLGAYTEVPSNTSSIESVLHQADMALYEAKDRGRNTYYIISDID